MRSLLPAAPPAVPLLVWCWTGLAPTKGAWHYLHHAGRDGSWTQPSRHPAPFQVWSFEGIKGLGSRFLTALEKHGESIFLKQSITAAVSRTNTLTLLFMYL